MRRRFGQTLRIGVSRHAVSLLRCGGWRGGTVALAEQAVVPGGDGFDAHGPALRALLADSGHAGWPVSFVLDDTLVRLWQVTPPPLAGDLADLEAAAAVRFKILYGESAEAWHMTAGWDARQPFFAAAVPRALLTVLQHAAAEHGMAVVGIAPHFISAWNRWCGAFKAGAWFCLMHDRVLTIAAIDRRRLRAVRAVPVPHGADHDWLTETMLREALLLDIAAPTLLQIGGRLAPIWRHAAPGAAHIACHALEPQGDCVLTLAGQLAACGSLA